MSELLKKPCSCRGSNPKCYMCGGWGYIDSISYSRIPTGQGQLAKPKPKPKPKGGENLTKSLNKPIKQKAKSRNKKEFDLRCAICGKKVDDLSKHNCVYKKSVINFPF